MKYFVKQVSMLMNISSYVAFIKTWRSQEKLSMQMLRSVCVILINLKEDWGSNIFKIFLYNSIVENKRFELWIIVLEILKSIN